MAVWYVFSQFFIISKKATWIAKLCTIILKVISILELPIIGLHPPSQYFAHTHKILFFNIFFLKVSFWRKGTKLVIPVYKQLKCFIRTFIMYTCMLHSYIHPPYLGLAYEMWGNSLFICNFSLP